MTLRYDVFRGAAIAPQIASLARLRVDIFREWPYLYAGDAEYEARYLAGYTQPDAVLVGAFSGDELVGAATAMPLLHHDKVLSQAIQPWIDDLETVFYCAESVLRAPFRGQGAGHRFFDLREAHAQSLGFVHSVFCAVCRQADHPFRPVDYSPLDGFWRTRGYEPIQNCTVDLAWRDVGASVETAKSMQVWHRRL